MSSDLEPQSPESKLNSEQFRSSPQVPSSQYPSPFHEPAVPASTQFKAQSITPKPSAQESPIATVTQSPPSFS